MRAQGEFEQAAGTRDGCLAKGCGCLIIVSGCLILVLAASFIIVFHSDDSSVNAAATSAAAFAAAATSGFSAAALQDIPVQYLQLYQVAAAAYPGLPAALAAAVGKVESDHGRSRGAGVRQPAHPDHLLASGGRDDSALANFAGAAGPMQIGIGGAATRNFQGSNAWGSPWDGTWHGAIHPAPPPGAPVARYGYGIDANGDGLANVYDPADAIFTGARMLYTAWDKDPNGLQKAIHAYNPSGVYVSTVWDHYNRYLGSTAPTGASGSAIVAARWAPQLANRLQTTTGAGCNPAPDLADPRLDLRVQALLILLAQDWTVQISCVHTGHTREVAGTDRVSNHFVWRAVDIDRVNNEPVTARSRTTQALLAWLDQLQGPLRPAEVGSPFPIAHRPFFTDGHHLNHIHIGYGPPTRTRIAST